MPSRNSNAARSSNDAGGIGARVKNQSEWRNVVTSLAIRNQVEDHLLTPKNCALIVIDYQPAQVGSVASMDRREPNDDRLGRRGVRRRRQGHRPQEAADDRAVDGSLPQLPTLDAIREGYEVYPVVDAVGGTSVEAHRAALDRVIQAGARPTSWVQVLCELQRDWLRDDTARRFAEILFTVEGR
jgi:nicotinamidase-related amidase